MQIAVNLIMFVVGKLFTTRAHLGTFVHYTLLLHYATYNSAPLVTKAFVTSYTQDCPTAPTVCL